METSYCSHFLAELLANTDYDFGNFKYVINEKGEIFDAASRLGHASVCDGTELPTCTHRDVIEWLRSEHNLKINVTCGEDGFGWEISRPNVPDISDNGEDTCRTREEAEEQAMILCLSVYVQPNDAVHVSDRPVDGAAGLRENR